MLRPVFLLFLFLAGLTGFAQPAATPEPARTPLPTSLVSYEDEALTQPLRLAAGKYAVFHTSEGDFIALLLEAAAPKTVANFIGLATGTVRWTHPITLAQGTKPLYNNTTIYEVIRDIGIRGGDPINKGNGGPGHTLDIETAPGVGFEAPGVLAMQLSGNQANGSRWFITLTPFPDWNGKYSVFGKVVGGLDLVRAISRKPTKRPTVPLDPVLVESIEILDVPQGTDATATYSDEGGRRVLTVDKQVPYVPKPADKPTTPTDAPTTPSAPVSGTTTFAPPATF
jgi:peptidyl-prolyl cis-trans isomerase A (cyclophilin A)